MHKKYKKKFKRKLLLNNIYDLFLYMLLNTICD